MPLLSNVGNILLVFSSSLKMLYIIFSIGREQILRKLSLCYLKYISELDTGDSLVSANPIQINI